MSKCKYWNEEHQDCSISYDEIRADAIDEFVKEIKKSDRYKYFNENNVMKLLRFEEEIEQIAEQLKEQNNGNNDTCN